MTATQGDEGASMDQDMAVMLTRHSPDAVVLVRDGAITETSAQAGDVLASPSGTVTGMSLDDVVHPDDRDAVNTACREARAGMPVALVANTLRPTGVYAPAELRVSPPAEADGTEDLVMLVRDINDVIGLRESAVNAEFAPRRLASRAGDVLFILDGSGTVLDVEGPAYEMTGWLPEELEGMTLPPLIHPDDAAALIAYRDTVWRDTAAGSIEIRFRTRGGAFRWVQATGVLVRPATVPGLDDMRVLVAWRDVDHLVRETRLAEREEARLRSIMDTALDPWLMLTPLRDRHGDIVDFIIEDANTGAAEYLRWPRERLQGARLLEEFPGVGEQGLMAAYIDAMDSGERVTIHDLVYPHEVFGETRLFELQALAVGGSLILTWRDTTSSSRARDELMRGEALFRQTASLAGDSLLVVTHGKVAWSSPGASALALAPGADFEESMCRVVVHDCVRGVRTCALLMDSGHPYTGRWLRPSGPALVVAARPKLGNGGSTVVTIVEEAWTEAAGAP